MSDVSPQGGRFKLGDRVNVADDAWWGRRSAGNPVQSSTAAGWKNAFVVTPVPDAAGDIQVLHPDATSAHQREWVKEQSCSPAEPAPEDGAAGELAEVARELGRAWRDRVSGLAVRFDSPPTDEARANLSDVKRLLERLVELAGPGVEVPDVRGVVVALRGGGTAVHAGLVNGPSNIDRWLVVKPEGSRRLGGWCELAEVQREAARVLYDPRGEA